MVEHDEARWIFCYLLYTFTLTYAVYFFLHDGALRQAGIEDGCIYIQSIMVIHTYDSQETYMDVVYYCGVLSWRHSNAC